MDLPQGTLDLLILKVLSLAPLHGWAISERLHQVSRETLSVPQGSLYPALHRLERQGWISAEWGVSENNRKAKYYDLTKAGRKQLSAETAQWAQLSRTVGLVLDMG
jgi:PadR family transcriptional regulator, regulatory protein PadR